MASDVEPECGYYKVILVVVSWGHQRLLSAVFIFALKKCTAPPRIYNCAGRCAKFTELLCCASTAYPPTLYKCVNSRALSQAEMRPRRLGLSKAPPPPDAVGPRRRASCRPRLDAIRGTPDLALRSIASPAPCAATSSRNTIQTFPDISSAW